MQRATFCANQLNSIFPHYICFQKCGTMMICMHYHLKCLSAGARKEKNVCCLSTKQTRLKCLRYNVWWIYSVVPIRCNLDVSTFIRIRLRTVSPQSWLYIFRFLQPKHPEIWSGPPHSAVVLQQIHFNSLRFAVDLLLDNIQIIIYKRILCVIRTSGGAAKACLYIYIIYNI